LLVARDGGGGGDTEVKAERAEVREGIRKKTIGESRGESRGKIREEKRREEG
jgi:hypothetical protein